MLLLYNLLPLLTSWPIPVTGIALVLYTDTECKNQVGFLNGSYNGVCQATLGTAAISFKVVDPQSGCLVTLYPAANPPCPATPNNFGFAQIDDCYNNSNGSIAAYSIDLCDAPPGPPSEKTSPSPPSGSSSFNSTLLTSTLPASSSSTPDHTTTPASSSTPQEGLSRAETIVIGVFVPIAVAIPSVWIAWKTYQRSKNKKNSEAPETLELTESTGQQGR